MSATALTSLLLFYSYPNSITKVQQLETTIAEESKSSKSLQHERDLLLEQAAASAEAEKDLAATVQLEHSEGVSSKLQASLALCSSQKDQIDQLQAELLNSALQYGEQLDTFATELAVHVKTTNETVTTQQEQAGTLHPPHPPEHVQEKRPKKY